MSLLRAARSTDAGAVGGILSEFIDTTDWLPRIYTRAEDIAHAGALIARGWVTVATREGRVQGFAACDGSDLCALYVAAGMRGQGIGTALIAQLKQTEPALSLWTFQQNARAQAFYRAQGFVEVARTDGATNDEGLPDIRFQWQREVA